MVFCGTGEERSEIKENFQIIVLCCHGFGNWKNPIIFHLNFSLKQHGHSFCNNYSWSLLLSAHCLIMFLVASCQVRPFLLLSSHLMEIYNSLLFYSPLALVLCHLCKGTSPPWHPKQTYERLKELQYPAMKTISVIRLNYIFFFFFSFVINLFQENDCIPT